MNKFRANPSKFNGKTKLRIERCPFPCWNTNDFHYRLIWSGNQVPLFIGTWHDCWNYITRNREYFERTLAI